MLLPELRAEDGSGEVVDEHRDRDDDRDGAAHDHEDPGERDRRRPLRLTAVRLANELHRRLAHAARVPGSPVFRTPRRGYDRAVPDALYLTDDPEACELLARDPFALLMGVAIDQQVTVQKAFAGPLALQQRVGTLDPALLATTDLEPAFREKPAIHRFPGAMAARVRELAAVVAEEYGGDASRIWSEAPDADELRRRLEALPGFGPMKVTTIGSILAKRLGVAAAEPLVPSHHTLGDVDSPQALLDYQAAKRAHKAAMRAATP